MDLKSMLNDSSTQRQPPPRLHTSHSFERTPASTPSYDAFADRSQSHPQPLAASDYGSPPNGSYFAAQSPRPQNSPPGVTPGVTGQLNYAQSPGPHGQIQTPREGLQPSLPFQSPFVPSPSGPQPPTPGSAHHYQTPSSATSNQPPYGAQPPFTAQSPREDLTSSNGSASAHAGSRTLSPQAQFHPPPAPATPLGPPSSYPRPSPYQHRPLSQGKESLRRLSVSSVGSAHSGQHVQLPYGQSDHSRSGSVQRTYSGDIRDRERSVESVSPKTIPRPPPQQQTSLSQPEEITPDPYPTVRSVSEHGASVHPHETTDRLAEDHHFEATPKSTSTPAETRATSIQRISRPSPGMAVMENTTPQSATSPFSVQPSPPSTVPTLLKRSASHISSANATPQPPRKRLRRDEVPIFARSARSRPLRFIKAPPVIAQVQAQTSIKREPVDHQTPNGQFQAQTGVPATPAQEEPPWEPSITNVVPYEDLSRKVCDWIYQMIGMANPPGGGAMFEIEAKVGSIVDESTGHRLSLPVETETLFSRDKFRGRTSFHSSMDMAQHRLLNTFLNNLVQESMRESQTSDRQVIGYDHPHEYDEFYELTEEGRRNLPPSIVTWLNPRHKPRVRRTIDETTGRVKAQIIKSRIADIDIYNPNSDFDYRISISIESPWEGEPHWLSEMTDGGRDRKKDRMSYRHMAYQIDLTQVSYPNRPEKEHELEVEISTEQIRIQLANLREGRPSRYEDLVRGFLDNVRILCRTGTVNKVR
ncbi:hypothetical protein ABEF92_003629 [Exophiala dermatitidis]|uniref:mRNA-capping enzyme subunit beta n=1 Tax=Exophiala dermatitidis (strain ATCC 34100 / CBS 525.76 / NIH/UT8656) TaxID=858893 RepID=H6BMT6_EXODN|nr:polynucleotide 5'-phosphatase [Exophiala dermatitidis NIH/UT8656]EHY52114.1 polynucleotide 5'-phosphatase [Exophiala dermatitidis NIH/UT8656]